MDPEYPLFPELPEDGQKEAVALIEAFKDQLKKAAGEALSNLYTDVMHHIESDSWTNYRNHLLDGLKDYGNRKIQGAYDFKQVRQAILLNHREELIADLNQDMVEETESLKKQIADIHEMRSRF